MLRPVLGVTGASGFCGRAVVAAARAAGVRVVGIGRRPVPGVDHRPWDAASVTVPPLEGLDAVVHLAAAVGDPVGPAPSFVAVNVGGAERLLAAAGRRRVVWVSSASVYDPRLSRQCVREDHPTGDGHLNAYGATKSAGEARALAAGAVVLRPHAVYGAGDRHLLPRLLRGVRRGVLHLPGTDVPISLTAVENLASACLAALDWAPGAYNVADAQPYRRDVTVRAVLGAATGRSVRVRHVPVRAALAAAQVCSLLQRGREPLLTRYAVDLLGAPFTLDLTRALATGWYPQRTIADWVADLGAQPPRSART